jgi:hypothetical protein
MPMAAYKAAPAVTASTGVAKAGEQMRVASAMPIVSVFMTNLFFQMSQSSLLEKMDLPMTFAYGRNCKQPVRGD